MRGFELRLPPTRAQKWLSAAVTFINQFNSGEDYFGIFGLENGSTYYV